MCAGFQQLYILKVQDRMEVKNGKRVIHSIYRNGE